MRVKSHSSQLRGKQKRSCLSGRRASIKSVPKCGPYRVLRTPPIHRRSSHTPLKGSSDGTTRYKKTSIMSKHQQADQAMNLGLPKCPIVQGVRFPPYVLHANFEKDLPHFRTRSDDVFVATFPKSGESSSWPPLGIRLARVVWPGWESVKLTWTLITPGPIQATFRHAMMWIRWWFALASSISSWCT